MGLGKVVSSAIVFIAVAAARRAEAQEKPVTTRPDRGDTARATLSGGTRLDYVTRSREITAFTNSLSNPTHDPLLPSFPNPLTSDSENTFEGEVWLRLDVELSSRTELVFEVGTRRFSSDANGERINRFGETPAPDVDLREIRLRQPDVLTPGLSVEAGISTWVFNPRGKGGALAFDPRRSASVHENLHSSWPINGAEAIDARLGNAGFPLELQPVGGTVAYGSDAWLFEVVILPAVVEGGRPNGDEALYAADLWYNLPSAGKGSRIGAVVALSAVPTDPPGAAPGVPPNEHGRIVTLGGGGALRLMDGALEIFAEGYFQFGKAGETAAAEDVDAAGRAFRAGVEFHHTVANPMPIWAGFNFTLLTGDDDTDPDDDQADRFAAYESVADLMILEDPYYGFDWDSNYEAFKIYAGAKVSVMGGKDNLEVALTVGITRAAEEVGTGAVTEDKLGNEVDVRVKWQILKQASMTLAAAHLFGSDILEASMDAAGGPGSNPQADDRAYLYVFGIDVGF